MLLADKGEIPMGNQYLPDITHLEGEEYSHDQSKFETKMWETHSSVIDKQIDQLLVVAHSLGNFEWTLDYSSSSV